MTDFVWLIERNVVDHTAEWWTGEPGEDWTRDANRAVKFATKTAAVATMRTMRLGGYCYATEHGFISAATAIPEGAVVVTEERLAEALIEPYATDPTMGRCRVCGEDGSVVGYIDQPDAIMARLRETSPVLPDKPVGGNDLPDETEPASSSGPRNRTSAAYDLNHAIAEAITKKPKRKGKKR